MATGGAGGSQVCPLCNTVVEGGDQLQLHYLTSCSGYDTGNKEGGGVVEGKEKSPRAASPPAMPLATPPPSGTAHGGAAPGGAAPGNQCIVQFIWQPLTQMSYTKVTLLTSLESGSIELTMDPEGGYYTSERVLVTSGTYEGQLVVGDSFINPVKNFEVGEGPEQIVLLEFQVSASRRGRQYVPSAAAEEDMYMQENQAYTYDGVGDGGYSDDRDTSYRPRRQKTGVSAGSGNLTTFEQRQYFENHSSPSYLTTPPVYANMQQTTPPSARDPAHPGHAHSHHLSEEGFEPAVVKSKSKTAASAALRESSSSSVGPAAVSSLTTGADGETVRKKSERRHRNSPVGVVHESPAIASSRPRGSEFVVGSDERVKAKPSLLSSGREHSVDWMGGEKTVAMQATTPEKRVGARRGSGERERVGEGEGEREGERREFRVDSLQNHSSAEESVRQLEEQVAELQTQLAEMQEEKLKLQSDRERVFAQWEGKVRRLRKRLGEEQGEEALAEEAKADELDEVRGQLDVMSSHITALKSALGEKEAEVRKKERQLKEMKNMNAALENQLTEYMDALDHQNQSVKRTVESHQRGEVDMQVKYEQRMARMTDYMQKQQFEYQEALEQLQKKVGRAEEMERENLKIHQLNLNLTGELEDYRHQTKSLLADLREKEGEVEGLRRQLGEQGGSTRGQFTSSERAKLELDAMQQKCDAWREEVERLTPLEDEVAQLQLENARLQQEVARVTEDNAGLARQLASTARHPVVAGESGGRDLAELERIASDYDRVMERVAELQQIRVRLENELTPLRAERANILNENAALREASNPDKYLQLKESYTKLSEQCVQLQRSLTQESEEAEQLRKGLADERAINQRVGEANRELQTQLEATTDEKGLQAIRDRMDRYKSERDQLKLALTQSHDDLEAYQQRESEQLETIANLELALQAAGTQGLSHGEDEGSAAALQEQVATLSTQLDEANKRMYRYRDERNTGKIMLKSFQDQINTLQSTIQELQETRTLDTCASGHLDTAQLTRLHLSDDSTEVPSGRSHEAAYSPDEYVDQGGHLAIGRTNSGSGGRKLGKQSLTAPSSNQRHHRVSSGHKSPIAMEMYTEVTTKDGATQSLVIEKPRYKLNVKSKPEVVVKRKGGKFEAGILSYVGVLDGKEMAGVTLHFPTGNNDGAFRDGKHYFRCAPNCGIYCPMSNIFITAGLPQV